MGHSRERKEKRNGREKVGGNGKGDLQQEETEQENCENRKREWWQEKLEKGEVEWKAQEKEIKKKSKKEMGEKKWEKINREIREEISKKMGDIIVEKNVGLITGKKDSQTIDPQDWRDYDVIIYSPKIIAGVSCSVAGDVKSTHHCVLITFKFVANVNKFNLIFSLLDNISIMADGKLLESKVELIKNIRLKLDEAYLPISTAR
jgi:hypothetical protein